MSPVSPEQFFAVQPGRERVRMVKKNWRKRGGAPRQPGPRRNGRLVAPMVPHAPELLLRRAELVGDSGARDPRAGYPLGVLSLLGRVTDRQYDAGAAIRSLDARYRREGGMPAKHPRGVSVTGLSASPIVCTDPVTWDNLRIRYVGLMQHILRHAGPAAWAAVVDVVLYDSWAGRHLLDDLAAGLSVAADFFRLPVDSA